jgi:predicted CXXCH cytochrome family protein
MMLRLWILTVLFLAPEYNRTHYLEILYPPEYISTTRNNVYVIGKTTAPLVEVYLNQTMVKQSMVQDSIFHAQVYFGYGLNEITVKPIYSGTATDTLATQTVEVLFAPQIDPKHQRFYPLYMFHGSKMDELCSRCHQSNWGTDQQASDAGVCMDCHRSMREVFRKHTKEEPFACVLCHDFNADLGILNSERQSEGSMCFKCHSDRIGLFSQDYIHGPVAGGSCTICHNPHGSQFENSLHTPEQILCFSCHEGVEEQLNKAVVHVPFRDGRCGECHDPHSTNNRWVLIRNSEELCLKCHQPKENLQWHEHPYNVKPKRRLAVPLKLSKRGRLECISCHNPHSTDSEHLLRTKQKFTCIGCHPDMQ